MIFLFVLLYYIEIIYLTKQIIYFPKENIYSAIHFDNLSIIRICHKILINKQRIMNKTI